MTTIQAHDVRPGDVVDYRGQPHRINHVERRAGWAWPVAVDESGWAMALGDHVLLVHRPA